MCWVPCVRHRCAGPSAFATCWPTDLQYQMTTDPRAAARSVAERRRLHCHGGGSHPHRRPPLPRPPLFQGGTMPRRRPAGSTRRRPRPWRQNPARRQPTTTAATVTAAAWPMSVEPPRAASPSLPRKEGQVRTGSRLGACGRVPCRLLRLTANAATAADSAAAGAMEAHEEAAAEKAATGAATAGSGRSPQAKSIVSDDRAVDPRRRGPSF